MSAVKIEKLVVAGVGIAGSAFAGMDQFGYEVFRGKPFTGITRLLSSGETLKNSLEQVPGTITASSTRMSLVCMNASLLTEIREFSHTHDVVDLSGKSLDHMLGKVTGILENDEADYVLAVDRIEQGNVVSVIAFCSERIAPANHNQHLGTIPLSFEDYPTNPGLMLVQQDLTGFVNSPLSNQWVQSLSGFDELSCALADTQPGLFGLVKLFYCLKFRVIPAVPQWDVVDAPEGWSDSPFYVPTTSRTWFTPATQQERSGAIALPNENGGFSYIFLTSSDPVSPAQAGLPALESLCLIPLGGDSVEVITGQLSVFSQTDFDRVSLQQAARFQYRRWQKNSPHKLTACILGSNPEEVKKEIEYAISGIPEAAARSSDWRTPAGSIFSPEPLGGNGSIAFVYPGAFNSYPGVGQDLFQLFPSLVHRLTGISNDIGSLFNEKQLYPRSLTKLSAEDMAYREKQLIADPLAMLISGTCLAAVYTFLLREIFDIHPASSLGYSLGEISMMFASGVWTKADETAAALRNSPLFHNRLAGQQHAVREYWEKSPGPAVESGGRLWANYILMAPFEKVSTAIQHYPHVYVTHINTPRQVVIGGHPDECREVIGQLKCSSLEAPFNYALHCKAMESEYDALRELHSWPVQNQPGMTLFSAATNAPMPIESESIANQISYGLCHPLDFPQLVDTAYSQGARIFIELGAGSNCTRWVDESLPGRPHSAFSINRKGVDDYSAILQLLARLISHNVPVNLTPVFG